MATHLSVTSAPTGWNTVGPLLIDRKARVAQSIFTSRLQTIVHSIMSARIVFHVVNTTSKDIGHAGSSLEATGTQYYLSTQIEMESVVVSTLGNR